MPACPYESNMKHQIRMLQNWKYIECYSQVLERY